MGQVWYSQPACHTGTNTTCSNMLVPLGQVVLVPLGQAQTVPICLSHWDRLCLSQLLVPVGHATKRELYVFKSEAKRWFQTDNRPSAPSASADSATRMSAPHSFRNLFMYLYMYMLLLVCDWTKVFFIVCKRRFNPECFLCLYPVCWGLVLLPVFRFLTYLDLI